MKALKHGLGETAVNRIARSLTAPNNGFNASLFRKTALNGLEQLELKDRVKHVTQALAKALPGDYGQAIAILCAARNTFEPGAEGDSTASFAAWPVIEYVPFAGLSHFETSMDALRRLTELFSAEFAIRPFLERYPKQSLAVLRKWTKDPDPHVRRLVSEGTRPLLPWGGRLKAFQDRAPVVTLLEKLRDDESEYVRRSVANHLNDIGRDDAEALIAIVHKWRKPGDKRREWVIERATRSLVKAGHQAVFELLGHSAKPSLNVGVLQVSPRRVKLGGAVALSFEITSTSRKTQSLVVDYAIDHRKANGSSSPKVFKLKKLELQPGETVSLSKRHAITPITTRRYYSGKHGVRILIQGTSVAEASFDLVVPVA